MAVTYQTNIADQTYNGWSNYETWNVALWIQNDAGLYSIARGCESWDELQEILIDDLGMKQTRDSVLYNDPALNGIELNEMIAEL